MYLARGVTTLPGMRTAAVAVALLAVAGCGGSDEPDNFDAYKACENWVAERLRAPSTADFSGVARSEITRTDIGYDVAGYVDSQNGFGAQIRSEFTCQMRLTPDSWQLVDLSIS